MNDAKKSVLVLGATGGAGGATAIALLRRGFHVRALARDVNKAKASWPDGDAAPEWVVGDAMDGASVARAAEGCDVIVHAVNPPGYRNWAGLVVPMMENTIAAAKANGARIVLPGTVYNFGPDVFPVLTEDAPQNPVTRKGAIRVALEEKLREATSKGGVTALIVRAGDFFGPHSGGNNWFSQWVKPGQAPSSITVPGKPGVGHQWAYLPDVAETIARLLELPDLGPFERFHMQGHFDEDGKRMVEAIRGAVGRPSLPTKSFLWWAVALASPFVPLFRELREMRYLWEVPTRMQNDRLVARLGAEPHTPWDRAVRDTLEGLDCVPRRSRKGSHS